MRSSRFGVKSLFNILYATIILLPMFAVFGRLIYTQSNPNAKDSYSQKQVTNITRVLNTDYLLPNSTYILSDIPSDSFRLTIEYNYISIDLNTIFNTIDKSYYKFQFDRLSETHLRLYGWYKNEIDVDVSKYIVFPNENKNMYLPITFTLVSYSNALNLININLNLLTYSYDSLDNAFEYSLKSFTDDNNLGSVNLFSWFTDLFLNQSNSKNAIYLNFINWYMNYTLLVSSGYLIFLALIWFINYIRKILDKSMYHDFGGF